MEAWYTTPKPLIEVEGKPILEYVVHMFPGETNFLFVVNEGHAKSTNVLEFCKRIAPDCRITTLPKGQWPVRDIMLAKELIDDNDQTIVCYCDFNMIRDYAAFKKFIADKNPDWIIPSYIWFHPHLIHSEKLYGSMRVTDDKEILEIREKYSFTPNLMDCYQAAGMYYYKSGAIMKKYFQEQIDAGDMTNGEYYASLPYNYMIKDGLHSYVFEAEKFCQRGTPEDLQEYEYRAKKVHAWDRSSDDPKYPYDERVYNYRKEYFDSPDTKAFLSKP